jgi:transcriptional regulator with XRE-family HTH domain
MEGQEPEQAFADLGEVIGSNLRRLRTARRMSLVTLANRADVAKATLANLEQGRGNPTIETLWSLALGLGVAFSDLLEDRSETTTVVVRAQQGARVRGSTSGGKLDLRLLDRVERGGLVEVFAMFLPARTEHLGSSHGSGVVERVFVHEGTITVGPAIPSPSARATTPGTAVTARTSTAPRTRTATACCWSDTRLPREPNARLP